MRTIRTTYLLCAALVLLPAAMSGCAGGPRSELVVIPDSGETPAAGVGGWPFQVEKIYRLPATESSTSQPLGWSNRDTFVALSANIRQRDELIFNVQSFAPPYANSATLMRMDTDMSPDTLSTDGRYLSGTSRTKNGVIVKLLSLPDGEERTVAELAAGEARLISEAGAWSANSRYLAYLLYGTAPQQQRLQAQADTGNGQILPAKPEEASPSIRVLICDALNGTAAQYPLNGLDLAAGSMTVLPSNDASALLIVYGGAVRMAERDGTGYEVKFSPPAEGEGIVSAAADWVNGDQFVYLDEDGTLYAYDRRNGETVILLEKIGRFRLSRDRKAIAYFASGQNAVYAGKLQGNNILYGQSVYRGIVPEFMDWSPDGRRLLIDGRKLYTQTGRIARPEPTAEPSEALIVAEIQTDKQLLIVEFH